jgi:hypothetical protein
VTLLRRNLQQNYERTLIGLVLSAAQGTPGDAKSLARADLVWLSTACLADLKSGSLDSITRAHLELLLARAQQALAGKTPPM